MGSGWLVSALCVAPSGIYAGSGVGNQTAQLSVNTPTLRLPSGVSILNLIPHPSTLCCVRCPFVRCGVAQGLGFFFPAPLPAIPLQARIRIVYL